MSQPPLRRRARRALAATTAATLVGASVALLGGGAATAGTNWSGRPDRPSGSVRAAALAAARSGAGSDADGAQPSARALGLPSKGRYAFLLELDAASTATAQLRASGPVGSSAARSAGRSQLARVEAAQDAVATRLPAGSTVLYRSHAVLAGIAVMTDVKNLRALRTIAGVKAVHPIAPKTPSNSYAVPLQGAPAVWTGGGGVAGNTGQGTSVGVIDTGIDYTHANFGGPGTTAAYDQAASTSDEPADPDEFGPGNRVVGGTDLVGDDYNADPTADTYDPVPAPDANPLDCEGHGSHVAGSAGGSGVTAAGATYDGAYNSDTPFGDLRIGPGMAPQADLYAIRVFGCAGSTDVVAEAFDYAVDPNGDGDTSDHLDVVNLSLGSDFGTPYDADALAADRAAQIGTFSSISSGNSGDAYDVGGSPGTSARALTVAASTDAQSIVDTLNLTFSGSGGTSYGAQRSIAYDWDDNPDLAGTVVLPPNGASATGCNNADGTDPYPAGTFTKTQIVLLTWTDDALECGSVERSGNLVAAGAGGFIFADSTDVFSAGITGSAVIPGVLLAKTGADAVRTALNGGQTVRVTSTSANDFVQELPGYNDTLTSFTSRGTRDAGAIKPDVSAVGQTVFSTAVGTGSDGVSESGTSMAAPMTAGLAALVRTAHPAWSVEQVKADIVNTAGQDLTTGQNGTGTRYAPNRVGTGRIEAGPAVANTVLAYVSGGTGAVGVSFGPVEVTGPTTLTKSVTVDNQGTAAATYATSFDAVTSVPGVSYAVSPASVTVPAGGTATVSVTFTVTDPSLLTKTTDASRGRSKVFPILGRLPIETLADASGHLLLTPTTGDAPQLRVAVYSAPRPAATLTQPGTATFPRGSDTTSVTLSGAGLDQGTGAEAIQSYSAGLELQATSGVAPACSATRGALCTTGPQDAAADLKYVATGADDDSVRAADRAAYIGVVTQGLASTPASKAEFDVYLDVDGDGVVDLVGFNSRLPVGTDPADVFTVNWYDQASLSTTVPELVDVEFLDNRLGTTDLAVFDNDVMLLPINQGVLADYGLSTTDPRVTYALEATSLSTGQLVDSIGTLSAGGVAISGPSFNPIDPGLVVSDSDGVAPTFASAGGQSLTFTRNDATLARDQALGALMVHFHDRAGNKAQVVSLARASAPGAGTPPVATPAPGSTVNPKTHLKARVSFKRGPLGTTTRVKTEVATIGNGVATGKVVFRVNGKKVAVKTLKKGKASLDLKPTKRGKYSIRAVYKGDDTYAGDRSRVLHYLAT